MIYIGNVMVVLFIMIDPKDAKQNLMLLLLNYIMRLSRLIKFFKILYNC